MTDIPPILLVGFGKMGGAMLAGWRERGLPPPSPSIRRCRPRPAPR